jgi:hypothetical protein
MQAGRFGGQCVQVQSTQFNSINLRRILPTSYNNTALGVAVLPADFGDSPIALGLLALSGASVCGLRWNVSMGILNIYDATGALIFSSGAGLIFNSIWYYIEIEAVVATTSTGQLRVYLNNSQICNLTGLNLGTSPVVGPYMGATVAGSGAILSQNRFDDLYMLDVATRLTEQKVETLRGASDSAVTWTPNSGANNFSRINETLVDGDTSYVQTAGVGNLDLYGITALGSNPASISAVNIVSFAEKTDAGSRSIYHTAKSGGTQSDGSAINLSGYGRRDRLLLTDPNTAAPWVYTAVNSMLIGPKLAS